MKINKLANKRIDNLPTARKVIDALVPSVWQLRAKVIFWGVK